MASVNTNYGALVALQSLNSTTRELDEVQNRVTTGLKVSSARDNGAVFAIAEGQRGRVNSLSAVMDGMDRASSVIDVGLAAGEAIGDILQQMKEKAVAGQATDLSQDQRDALQADFDALRDQVDQIAGGATFNGSNLVNGTNLAGGASPFTVLTSDTNSSTPNSVTGTGLVGVPTGATSLATATGLTFDAGDHLDFTVTDGATTTTHTIDLASYAGTIDDFVELVASSTNGEVQATFNASTTSGASTLSFSSNKAFAVQFYDTAGTGTAKSEGGHFDNVATSAGGALSGGVANTTSSVTVSGFDFRLGRSGQALSGVTATLDVSTAAGAGAAVTAIDTSITALNKDLASMGAQAKALDVQKGFLGKLSDSIEKGIGNLVDADLAKESARLQSLQVKQQLGAQALSIANQAPSIVLSFFR